MSKPNESRQSIPIQKRAQGSLLGLATGDALGGTLEFVKPGENVPPVRDIIGGGCHELEPGEWTDDTSMALCLAESLIRKKICDPLDQLTLYDEWFRHGKFSTREECFDIGLTVIGSLKVFEKKRDNPFCGPTDASTSGNGSLMRLAPIPLFYYPRMQQVEKMASISSRTTHGSQLCIDSCRYYSLLIAMALQGADKSEILDPQLLTRDEFPHRDSFAPEVQGIISGHYKKLRPPHIQGTGYVIKSMEAALWSFHHSQTFRDGALLAANLRDDADTTAAIYGQLAGAYYGLDSIPAHWQDLIFHREMILKMATDLHDISPAD